MRRAWPVAAQVHRTDRQILSSFRSSDKTAAHRPGISSGFAAVMATVNNEEKGGWAGDNALAQTVDLPHCGRTLQNRLVKVRPTPCPLCVASL